MFVCVVSELSEEAALCDSSGLKQSAYPKKESIMWPNVSLKVWMWDMEQGVLNSQQYSVPNLVEKWTETGSAFSRSVKSHCEAIVKALVSHAVVRFDFLINLSGEVGWFLFFYGTCWGQDSILLFQQTMRGKDSSDRNTDRDLRKPCWSRCVWTTFISKQQT